MSNFPLPKPVSFKYNQKPKKTWKYIILLLLLLHQHCYSYHMLLPNHLIFEQLASSVKSSSNIPFLQLRESVDDKDLRFTMSLVPGCIFLLTRCFPSSAPIFLACGDVTDLRLTTLVTSCCTFPLLASALLTLGESTDADNDEGKDLRFVTSVALECTFPLKRRFPSLAFTFPIRGESSDVGKSVRFTTSLTSGCILCLEIPFLASVFAFFTRGDSRDFDNGIHFPALVTPSCTFTFGLPLLTLPSTFFKVGEGMVDLDENLRVITFPLEATFFPSAVTSFTLGEGLDADEDLRFTALGMLDCVFLLETFSSVASPFFNLGKKSDFDTGSHSTASLMVGCKSRLGTSLFVSTFCLFRLGDNVDGDKDLRFTGEMTLDCTLPLETSFLALSFTFFTKGENVDADNLLCFITLFLVTSFSACTFSFFSVEQGLDAGNDLRFTILMTLGCTLNSTSLSLSSI